MATSDPFRLDGLVAVVTGGTEGIGAAIAREFGRAGARLVVTSRRDEAVEKMAAELETEGVETLGVAADVRDEAAVERVFDSTVERFGSVDVLVNNAGGSFGDRFNRGELLSLSGDDFIEAYRLNLVGTFLCSKAAAPIMQKGGGGSIVHVSSMAAYQVEGNMGAYGAAKAAVMNLTTAMAHEWAPTVRVNALAPGHIDTPRVSARRSPERVQRLLGDISLGRMGTPEDVAHAARYLASPAAAWVTGSVIRVDGGPKLG